MRDINRIAKHFNQKIYNDVFQNSCKFSCANCHCCTAKGIKFNIVMEVSPHKSIRALFLWSHNPAIVSIHVFIFNHYIYHVTLPTIFY